MRVLLVEDDPDLRGLVNEALAYDHGHDVEAFATAEAAWDAWRAEPYPLALLDWMLPGMDGLELCRRIREAEDGRSAVVLVMTARTAPGALEEVLNAGADDYISKPFDMGLFDIRLSVAERRVEEVAERIRGEEAAKEAAKLEGVLLAARTAAHEVNNILALPVGYAELLALHPTIASDPSLHKQAIEIRNSAHRAAEILNRLQRVIRLEEASSPVAPDMTLLDIDRSSRQ